MAKTAYINMRIDENIKNESESILNELGLNISSAIDLFLIQIIQKNGLPFEVKLPAKEEQSRKQKLAEAINLTGGVTPNRKLSKIISLYASGEIDYDVALYAIKKEFTNA